MALAGAAQVPWELMMLLLHGPVSKALGLGDGLVDKAPNTQAAEAKMDNWDGI